MTVLEAELVDIKARLAQLEAAVSTLAPHPAAPQTNGRIVRQNRLAEQ